MISIADKFYTRASLDVKKLAALKQAIGGEENCEGKQDSLAPSAIRLLQVDLEWNSINTTQKQLKQFIVPILKLVIFKLAT